MSKRRTRLSPVEDATGHVISQKDKPWFEERLINAYKGRGVFALMHIESGCFVLEYKGKLISQKESFKRQRRYTEKQNGFLFDFEWNGSSWCIDASEEDGTLGRLVNDDAKNANCKMKKIVVNGRPHLCLFAIKNILPGEEITYDYGDSAWPWRSLVKVNISKKDMLQKKRFGEPEPSLASERLEQINTISQNVSSDMQEDKMTRSPGEPEPSLPSDGCTPVPPAEWNVSSDMQKDKMTRSPGEPEPSLASDGCTPVPPAEWNVSSDMQEDKMTRSPGEPEPSLASDGCTPVLPAEWTAVMDESTDYSECTDYSDEDYEPNIDSESSDLSSCSRSAMLSNISPKKLKRNNDKDSVLTRIQQKGAVKAVNSQCQVSSSEIHASSSRESCPTEPDTSTPSDQGCVHVVPMPTSSKSWRYAKKQYCLYCEKPYSKISRHLQYVHHNEPDVAKAFSFDKKSKERRVRLRLLTTRGNFLHNALISSSGKGDLVARRRPQKLGSTQEFTHCIHCQGLYARKSLWRHIRNCPQNPKVDEPGNRKKMVQSLNCMARVPPDVSKAFWKTVMCQMKHDEVSAVIRNDKYILLFGEQMFNKLNPSSTKNDYIRQKMREVGRLLLEARRLTPIRSMEDFVLPSNFPHVIKSVRAVSGHCEETNTYRIPSLALKLGHSLSKIATSVECSAIITGRERLAEDARSFRVLQEHKWNESISAAAGTTLNEAKMNKPQVLPFTEDVKTLHSFLNTEMTKYQHALKDHSDVKTYASLCKLVLAKVILFNRRRGGEASRMKLESYVSRVKSPVHEDLASGLSDFEKKLCEHFQRVEIRGKRGRKVAVLLTPDMVNCMDLLVQHRDICQVPEENVHLFARPNALSSYRGSDVLREFGESCGARNPSALSSTKLRKQIATLSTVLNLKDNEMDQLASFLGHDIRIHRQYYRLPESTLQLAKMSKLLIAMERGTLSEFQGATLDEIVINPQDEIEDSNADTSSDEAESDDPQPSCSSRTPEPSPSESAQFSNPHDRGNKGMKRKHDLSLDQSHQHSTQTTGITQSKKKWSDDEVQAVEKHLMRFINSCQVPGKKDCVSCLLSEPDALKHRDWTALKYYVKNRIVALKRRQSL